MREKEVILGIVLLLIFLFFLIAAKQQKTQEIYVDYDIELVAEVESLLETAEMLINKSDFVGAYALLNKGLELIGQSYYFKGVVDDSGQKLLLADIFWEEGRLEGAVKLKSRILRIRLELLKNKK